MVARSSAEAEYRVMAHSSSKLATSNPFYKITTHLRLILFRERYRTSYSVLSRMESNLQYVHQVFCIVLS